MGTLNKPRQFLAKIAGADDVLSPSFNENNIIFSLRLDGKKELPC